MNCLRKYLIVRVWFFIVPGVFQGAAAGWRAGVLRGELQGGHCQWPIGSDGWEHDGVLKGRQLGGGWTQEVKGGWVFAEKALAWRVGRDGQEEWAKGAAAIAENVSDSQYKEVKDKRTQNGDCRRGNRKTQGSKCRKKEGGWVGGTHEGWEAEVGRRKSTQEENERADQSVGPWEYTTVLIVSIEHKEVHGNNIIDQYSAFVIAKWFIILKWRRVSKAD
jgi:hypothetical protein